MLYPRFTKVIIDYFMSKDQSISRRNKMFWHTAQDDTMFTTMRCISRHEKTQKTLKPKYVRKKDDLDTSPKKKPDQATKGDGVDTQSKVPDEQQLKVSSTNEGASVRPKVPDIPQYDSENNEEAEEEKVDDEEGLLIRECKHHYNMNSLKKKKKIKRVMMRICRVNMNKKKKMIYTEM
nr:hypothetical protein [Tanacetum cinerariifolium]GFA53984.1 hypothetical protein [Tanacetum cinerariifolium]